MKMLTPVKDGQQERDPLANVVLVHGIGSSSTAAWKPEDEQQGALPQWLSEDLERDVGAPVNVWLIDYPAEVYRAMFFSFDRDDSVPQRAAMLGDIVLSQQLAKRPVIFITHSLGGILVKQMLRSAIDTRQYGGVAEARSPKRFNLALSTKLVIFISTPHHGSLIANMAEVIPGLSAATLQYLWSLVDWIPASGFAKQALAPVFKRAIKRGPFTKALERRDPYLEDLDNWYRHNAPQLQIETRAYYENLKYRVPGGVRTLTVVTKDSANPGVGCEVIALEGDHATVCKPATREHDNYTTIRSAVRDVLNRRCPVFLQTHQAVLDVGESFDRLTELPRADRLAAAKKVVQPIEVLLGRDPSSVDYFSSSGSQEEFKPQKWQLDAAPRSAYDLDRIIYYVYCERVSGLPAGDPTIHVRQETERIRTELKATKDVTVIPLHYAVRALRRQYADNKALSASSSDDLRNTKGLVQRELQTGSDKHADLLANLEAVLGGKIVN